MKKLYIYLGVALALVIFGTSAQAVFAVGASGGPQPTTSLTSAEICQNSGGTWVATRGTTTGTGVCTNCQPGKQISDNKCVEITSFTSPQVVCPASGFFGLPAWYKYLSCDENIDSATGAKVYFPRMNGLQDIWRVVAAVIEILLRLSSVIAIGFVVYGGFTYTLSQGSPDKTSAALKTIIAALVGLLISIIAAALVGFIAGRFNNTATASTNTSTQPTQTPLTNQQQPR